ncbi:hypothetical protein K490DRAFT_42281 [Saccharata proteae CBS 121410]|uniref:DUF3431 domain containing protein n=1 Tax=Saccharata proteae CBS 121410 TaxID=1314787 RepID=A0A9P4HXP6_9PEZI|nr:hypothetical protein K490DRAFT_42281 [Saccharata proteae CBS 121410]
MVEKPAATKPAIDGIIVVGKQKNEDTDWIAAELPEWQNAIYVVNDHTAPLHTIVNKGREAQPYLTYIVDNYHNLPETIVFLHPHRAGYPVAWHTDAPGYSNVASIKSLNIDFVQRNGYANLRCIFIPGCPDEVQPFREPRDETRTIETNMPAAWFDLFNTTDVPSVIATPCCAQFAVSRDQVLKRPWEDYKKYHTWLLDTSLDDDTSGRIFEYLWHIIFGQDPVYCPDKDQCYFDVYGRE